MKYSVRNSKNRHVRNIHNMHGIGRKYFVVICAQNIQENSWDAVMTY